MLKTGAEYLQALRDGRVVYLGGEKVDDVTAHPAFRNSARSYARIYDARSDNMLRDLLTAEVDGERIPTYYLPPYAPADLERRTACHAAIADLTYGMMGRSPDFIGGYITGAAMQAEVFPDAPRDFRANVVAYHRRAMREDLFVSHAVTPPPGSRDPAYTGRAQERQPALAVVGENDAGVFISGMKMLATSAAFSDEVWIGNIQPLATGHEAEAITCAIPCNTPGLSLWSRKSYEQHAVNAFDNPVSSRFDESDCVVVCDGAHVPWERVFVHGDSTLSREMYFRTPAHTLSNHQSGVRYRTKFRLLLALARRVTRLSGTERIPAVADELGHLAALYGQLCAMIEGQIQGHERLPGGHVNYNRHFMYATIYFATQNYDAICAKVRELSGGGVLQMPADISVLDNPATRDVFLNLWEMPTGGALERYKLMKLIWDVLGSEFAARHAQYERFYMGPAFIVRSHNSRECAWEHAEAYLDGLLDGYGLPGHG